MDQSTSLGQAARDVSHQEDARQHDSFSDTDRSLLELDTASSDEDPIDRSIDDEMEQDTGDAESIPWTHECYRLCQCLEAICMVCLDVDRELYGFPNGNRVPHTCTSLPALQKSSEDGCKICLVLYTGIMKVAEELIENHSNFEDVLPRSSVTISLSDNNWVNVTLWDSYIVLLMVDFHTEYGICSPIKTPSIFTNI
jgi:hypothetical protein